MIKTKCIMRGCDGVIDVHKGVHGEVVYCPKCKQCLISKCYEWSVYDQLVEGLSDLDDVSNHPDIYDYEKNPLNLKPYYEVHLSEWCEP